MNPPKTSVIDVWLACPIWKSYGFYGLQGRSGSFSGKIRSQLQFGCIAQKLMHYFG